jgi:Tol biopolymer transport system component
MNDDPTKLPSPAEIEEVIEAAVARLNQAWKTAADPDLAPLLPPQEDPRRTAVLLELIKTDQEHRWQQDDFRLLEVYLRQWPELCENLDAKAELIEAECLVRADCGQPPTREALEFRFPEVLAADSGYWPAIEERLRRAELPGLGLFDDPIADTPRESESAAPARWPAAPELAIGQRLNNRYVIRELLGEGAMGRVYRAHDEHFNMDVALKVSRFDLGSEPQAAERFLEEARAAAKVNHPNVCRIFDANRADGLHYISMALVEGKSLKDRIQAGRIAPRQAAELVLQLARGLEAVHAKGVVHRDIKPGNVMLDDSVQPAVPLLMDFGLARQGPAEFGAMDDRSLVGTLPYMSPEQARGEATHLSDIYSLGAVLYHLLTRSTPFSGPIRAMVSRVLHDRPPAPREVWPDLDPPLEAICLKAMARDTAERFQSAGEMAQAFERYLRKPRRRWGKWLAIAAAAAMLALASMVAYVKTNHGTLVLQVQRWIETGPRAAGISFSSDGKKAYVAYGEHPNPGRVRVFEIASGAGVATVDFPDGTYDHHGQAISRDGRYLYVTNYYRHDISRVALDDGNARQDLPVGRAMTRLWAQHMAVTPDGRKLVVTLGGDGRIEDLDNDGVAVVDVADGRFSLLGRVPLNDEPVHQIAVSGDSRFAYVITNPRKSRSPTLYEISLTEPLGVPRELAFPGSQLTGIAVSGRLQRAFVSDAAKRTIQVVDLTRMKAMQPYPIEGCAPARLSLGRHEELLAVVSPESRKLFLLAPGHGRVLARVDGLRTNLTGAEFSPDGSRLFAWHGGLSTGGTAVVDLSGGIVFASNRGGEGHQIYRLCSDGKAVVRLTNNPGANRCPRWSPDGQRIAFVSTAPGKPRICITSRDGTALTVLKNTDVVMPEGGATLDWSSDGTEIAFLADRMARVDDPAIRVVNAQSGKVRTLPMSGDLRDKYKLHLSLSWRRSDGQLLVNSQLPGSSLDQGIYLVDPHSGKTRRIMDESPNIPRFVAPVPSPDGTKIASLGYVQSAPSGGVFVMDAKGTDASCLVRIEEKVQPLLRWMSNSTGLLYSAEDKGRQSIYFVGLRDKKSRALAAGDWDDLDPDIHGDLPQMAPESGAERSPAAPR